MPKSQSMSRPVLSNDEQLNELSSSVVRHQIDASEVHAARPLGVSFRAKNLDSSDGPGGHDPGTVLVARAVSDDGRFDVSDCAVRRGGRVPTSSSCRCCIPTGALARRCNLTKVDTRGDGESVLIDISKTVDSETRGWRERRLTRKGSLDTERRYRRRCNP